MTIDLEIRIADQYGPEIVARLAREIGTSVPIGWDSGGRPWCCGLTVRIVAFSGCLHVNAYDNAPFGADLLPLTERGLGQSVPFGARTPSTAGWVDDLWAPLLEVVTRAVRLVEAHTSGDVCPARIGYTHQSEDPQRTTIEAKYPYRCHLATHADDQPHQHGRHHWTGTTPPLDGNGPMACAPAERADTTDEG